MYTTKPRSMFMSYPEVAFQPPPEGHISAGCLVVDDTDAGGAAVDTWCWGTCFRTRVRELPFPQNLVLTVEYREGTSEHRRTYSEDVVFVPVPGLPLAPNRYYVVIAKGKHKGLVRACSSADDMTPCCCWMQVNDAKPRPFHPADVYQQMEVVPHRRRRGWFTARAVAADGIPCLMFRKKYWAVYASKPRSFDLGEASGVNASLRSSHGLAGATVPTTGKWYCPFFLVKEDGVAPWQQMDRSMFYEVTLVQRWEPVHALGVGGGAKLASKKALIGASVEATQESAVSSQHGDAYVWFRAASTGQRVGLCASVWERMRWEEYRRGWVDDEADAENVAGGSVLVERFVFKRMDGSVALAFSFVHLNKVWEDQL